MMIECISAKTIPERQTQLTEQLAQVLIDCVEQGASVSFMHPLPLDKAISFWQGVIDSVARGERLLLVAHDAAGQIQGTVQIITAQPDNQPHRADIAKMLVHSKARHQGVGQDLMQTAEREARMAGKSLLVLDTVTGSAGWRLYLRCGWQIVGDIPGFALWPQGGLVATTFMYKQIA